MNTNIIKSKILKYANSKNNFTLVKKKKNYYIVDGIINYGFDPINLNCSCSNTICVHIIFYLTTIIGININHLFFFNKIKKNYGNFLKEQLDCVRIKEKIINFLKLEIECVICCDSLFEQKFENNIVECFTCNYYCHKICFDTYKSKNHILNDICIYCKSGNMI
jgi:hypothetical protein